MNTKLPPQFLAVSLTSLGLGIHLYTVSLGFTVATQLGQPGKPLAQLDFLQSSFVQSPLAQSDSSQTQPLQFSQPRGIPGRRAGAGSR